MTRIPTETRSKMCSTKRRFKDRKSALMAIERIRTFGEKRAKTPTRPYRCPACKGWHLSSEDQ
jgi:hypothetical protein